MKSVTGGGHSGGGIFINTFDQARFGLLFLHNGQWGGKQVISADWVKAATTSSTPNPGYGYMWWLNKGDRKWAGIEDESIFYAAGFGGNYVVVDQTNNLVVVTRWLEPSTLGDFMKLVYDSIE
jgi:CubicO group peptidase (beta-lactamase class C family)